MWNFLVLQWIVLDVCLDLLQVLVQPYCKPNNEVKYVNCKSNHPPHVVRNIPKGIEWRLSSISSNEEVFYANKAQYNAALAAAGYKEEIKYRPEILETIKKGEQKQKEKRKRTRHIIHYNPPFSMLLATNLSYEVRRIVKECFPKSNKLSKIINKNTVKTAYCTTANLEAKIKQHNTKILRETNAKKEDKT